ncbi:hypothetical protein BDW74DRAFT_147448 [Aspergillus multicolor]|uniref:uncharacterized protein n=1 Tax=Aspergillus multicolor TaxID=41759 RepID=UPI003CCE1977
MSLREKLRKLFGRNKFKASDTGIKIVYYRRGEIPPSKFKGPFDKEHQKRLAAWSFDKAQEDRPRSPDLSLSPCTTLPDYLRSPDDADPVPDQARPRLPGAQLASRSSEATPAAYHDEFIQDRQANESLSSTTAVDPESFSDSTMTLFLDPLEDDSPIKSKEPIRNTAPHIPSGTTSALPAKGMPSPFVSDDLALNAVQICS